MEISLTHVAVRIAIALLLGGILGMERGLKQRPAGLRTHMLVCVGACLIMLTNLYICQVFGGTDPVRMGAQVVSGIGFLGAGTIVVTRHNQIRGLTTAAGLWAAAAVGLATGVGFYQAAVLGTVAIFATLTVLSWLEGRMRRKARHFDVYLTLTPAIPLGQFLTLLRKDGISVEEIHPDVSAAGDENRHYFLTLSTPVRQTPEQLMAQFSDPALGGFYLDIL